MTWPSSFPANTLGWMIDRIDDELTRNGTINSQIQQYIFDAILTYQKDRFRFNETFTTTFTTVGGQQNYNSMTDTSYGNITSLQQFLSIDWMTITVGIAVFDVPKIQPEELLILTQTASQQGQPYCYAMSNETIMLYPVPSTGQQGSIGALGQLAPGTGYTNGNYTNVPLSGGSGTGASANIFVAGGQVQSVSPVGTGQGYVLGDVLSSNAIGPGTGFNVPVISLATGSGPFKMTIGGHVQYLAPAATNTAGNRWMIDGERLIRSRAKYELAKHLINDPYLAKVMSPKDPDPGEEPGEAWLAFKELKGEANKLTGRGVIRPMYF